MVDPQHEVMWIRAQNNIQVKHVCVANAADLAKINQTKVVLYRRNMGREGTQKNER